MSILAAILCFVCIITSLVRYHFVIQQLTQLIQLGLTEVDPVDPGVVCWVRTNPSLFFNFKNLPFLCYKMYFSVLAQR